MGIRLNTQILKVGAAVSRMTSATGNFMCHEQGAPPLSARHQALLVAWCVISHQEATLSDT
jgi:hypothetical protein